MVQPYTSPRMHAVESPQMGPYPPRSTYPVPPGGYPPQFRTPRLMNPQMNSTMNPQFNPMMMGQKSVVPFPSPGMNPQRARSFYMNPQQPIEQQPPPAIPVPPPQAPAPATPAKRRGGGKKKKENKNQSQ